MSGTENILVEQVLNFSKMVTKHDQKRKKFRELINIQRVDKYSGIPKLDLNNGLK